MRLLPDNTYDADPTLREALSRRVSAAALERAEPALREMGRAAAHELREWSDEAEGRPPFLRSIDPWGERVDEVVYGEAWRRIGEVATRSGTVSFPYETPGPEGRVLHAALCYLFSPSSATYSCPVAMTDAAARVLLDYGSEGQRDQVVRRLVSRDPDTAWTAGQWMTEQQGGSDVGANAVEARCENGEWRLYGRKYFCSNVGGELVLVLARPTGAEPGTRGLGLFLLPRLLPDGSRNRYRIDRLKDKLGTRAMATGEVTLEGAWVEPVGRVDEGFRQMTPMLNVTRFHNAVASAATMRRSVMIAYCFATQRTAFGKRLDLHPLHREVMQEMSTEADRSLALVLRLAELLGKLETGEASDEERLVFRVGTSLAKLYTAKKAVAVASEAIECCGGAGYMEDTGLARLLRDAQVLPIWEGTTNVLSLDVMRTLERPGVRDALSRELGEKPIPPASEREARRLALKLTDDWIDTLMPESAA